jgi:hypothetical protein
LEKELVSDLRLLLVAYCLVNYWKVENIYARYDIGESEMFKILAKLDRMKLIELLPGNKVRLLIAKEKETISHKAKRENDETKTRDALQTQSTDPV